MSILVGGYVGARACTSGPSVGAKNLMAHHLAVNAQAGGTNRGIYNCRPVRGGSITSLHGEGRAADLGCPVGNTWMQFYVDGLVAMSAELGIQCIIYNQRIWSSSYPHAGWRPYDGVNPHRDHGHVELTPWAAANLTYLRISEILGSSPTIPAPVPAPGPAPASNGRPTIRRGAQGQHVRDLQARLARGFPLYRHQLGALIVDGDFGPKTEAWVREFQRRSQLTVDGIVGPRTWRALRL
jgi:hypothetical protein